jgi:hypothetical protein
MMPGEYQGLGQGIFPEKLKDPFIPRRPSNMFFSENLLLSIWIKNLPGDGINDAASNL